MVKATIQRLCKEYNFINDSVFKKEKGKYLIGRKTDCDLVINDPRFSREQFMFIFDSNKNIWYVKDGGNEKSSGSGTW